MASMKLVGQMEEQKSATKPRIDNAEEQEEIGSSNASDLPKSTELKDEVLENSTMNLPPSSRVPLPLELNCEIFKCLKLPIQRKFIWGLGRDIYGMFGQKLLKKTKRVRNPRGNRWNNTNTRAKVAADGLSASTEVGYTNVFAAQPFPISGPQCRIDEFPGTILYYYEVKARLWCLVGLFGDAIPNYSLIGQDSNSYAIYIVDPHYYRCWLDGAPRSFELLEGAIRPQNKENGNVFGCGLILDPDNKLAIFFTLNGQLLGRKIPITPTVDRLFPAVTVRMNVLSIEANFGDDPTKPFEYDIQNCPGMGLDCI